MKRIKSSLFVKIIAILLFIVSGLGTVLGTAMAVYMETEGVYEGGGKQFAGTDWEQEITYEYKAVLHRYLQSKNSLEPNVKIYEWSKSTEPYLLRMESKLNSANTNFCYRVTEYDVWTGNAIGVLANSSMENMPVVYKDRMYTVYVTMNGDVIYYSSGEDLEQLQRDVSRNVGSRIGMQSTYCEYLIEYGMNPVVSKMDSYYFADAGYSFCVQYRYELIGATVGAAVLWLLSLIFLCSAAGHKKKEEGIVPNLQDSIPFDLYLAIYACVVACIVAAVSEISYYTNLTQVVFLLIPIVTVIGFGLLATLLMTFATRCKAKTLFRNTLCGYVIRFCIKMAKKLWGALMSVLRNLPYIWVQLCAVIVLVLANILLAIVALNGDGYAVLLWLGLQCVAVAAVVYFALCMHRIMQGAKKLADGQQRTRVSDSKMVLHYKDLAGNLNRLGEGMERAVAEQVKSQRMKTELITNVSHDIKTPITSLISYVDLLKKEEIENETAKEYIEVLERQAARLKKLTEDLIEASKASTGNIAVNIMPTDVVELLHQSIAEYADRLEASHLIPMVNAPQDKVVIPADGRLLWRIYDNLLSNICKYSMPNTRVYFDVAQTEEQVQITVKNISREVLNISVDELKERFVRGDSARHTDGSGLGLSIAESLTQLQGGSFHLFVDGDLFKAVLVFSRLEAAPEPVEEPDEWEVGNVEMMELEAENPVVTVYTAEADMVEETVETDMPAEEITESDVSEQISYEDAIAATEDEYSSTDTEMQKAYEEDKEYDAK